MTRIKFENIEELRKMLIELYYDLGEGQGDSSQYHFAERLEKQILEDYEFRECFNFEKVMELKDKAEKWKKLIESQTFDFEPIDDVEEITRQLINNEIRTTHKLYEENKELESQVKELKEVIELKDRTIKALDNKLKESEKLLSMR